MLLLSTFFFAEAAALTPMDPELCPGVLKGNESVWECEYFDPSAGVWA